MLKKQTGRMMEVQGLDGWGRGTKHLLSELTTEEDLTMLRLRLAYLALASGVLFTLSGCCSFCENGRFTLFPNRTAGYASYGGADCDCHNTFMSPAPTMMMQGPVTTMPMTATAQPQMPTQIPITDVPTTPRPQLFRVPNAPPTAYVPN